MLSLLLKALFLMVLNCVSFNARGLMNKAKFGAVVEQCKNKDVIALQETKRKNDVMTDFKTVWSGEILFSNGDGRTGRGWLFF